MNSSFNQSMLPPPPTPATPSGGATGTTRSHQASLHVAAGKVVDELKRAKRGLTVEEIEKKTNYIVNDALKDMLNKNPHLEWNEKTQRYVFKFKHDISNKEDMMEHVKTKGPLLIDDDLIGSYENIHEDMQELKDQHQILIVQHQKKKKNVIFFQPHISHPKELPWQMETEIRELWNQVTVLPALVDLKQFLLKNNIKLALLDTNVVPEELRIQQHEEKKGRKKKRTSSKANSSSDLAALARSILEVGNEETATIKLNTSAGADEEIDESKKLSLLYHNVEANREEFELVSDLIRIVGYWFYEDIHVVILSEFLKQKIHRDSELIKSLLLSKNQLSGVLQKLSSHQLLYKKECVQGSRSFIAYGLDLDQFVNSCNYRLFKMQDNLTKRITTLGNSILKCPACEKMFTPLDVHKLHNDGAVLYCQNCNRPLEKIDNSDRLKQEKLLEKLKTDLAPLHDMLNKLVNGKESKNLNKQSSRRTPRRGPVVANRSSRTSSSRGSDVNNNNDNNHLLAKESDFNLDPEPKVPFYTNPIYFSKGNEVFLPICKDWSELEPNIALRLAKILLDEVAEFTHIVNAVVYVYKLTEHSLYLAWCNGYCAEEIIRLFKTLARNPLPVSVERFIRDYVNDKKFYKATMILRNKQFCVQSSHSETLEALLKNSAVREMAQDTSKLQEVKTNLGHVSYHFAINPGCSEKMKRVCKDMGVSLIDEFDYANSSLLSIKIDMKPATSVRAYQEFAVSRLFWNGFKCHSGILVLPCGAGKTLIGINVVAALKKPCIIYCQSILAVTQWKEQLLRWTTINENSVSRFSSSFPTEWNPGADVIVTTYGMFSTPNRSGNSQMMMNAIKEREWGLMLLDEVHLVPAKIFRKVTNQIRSHVKLGLTATMVRQDELIADLPQLVGPKLYELDIFTLRMHRYISPVECVELHCPLTDIFQQHYNQASVKEEEQFLYSINPNKIRVVWTLIKNHIERKHRIMVFCDNLFCLNFYTEILKKDKIDGSTTQEERSRILRKFRETEGDCILFSQVGDQSIDLPEADVVIQVALLHGGRMQEGQRIGRIQRFQEGKVTGYFYSLVSDKTKEEEFAKKRRNFLQEHGYIIKRLKGRDYEQFLTDDLAHVTHEATQVRIIEAIKNELQRRETERVQGKMPEEKPEKKRKKSNHSQQEIAKRSKRIKQAK